MKYYTFKNWIPQDVIQYLREYTSELKKRNEPMIGSSKPIGSGTYWQGIDMASSYPLASDEENQKLFDVYTSKFMYDTVTTLLKDPYLFNDQIVVKEPYEDFQFEPHFDNQFGPYPGDESLVTMNFMLVLDDFTPENGGISVFDEEWITLYPKTGDILMIEGNTLHASAKNNSAHPRRAYLCVYSNRPIGEGFQQGFYSNKFDI